jgi:hypothetical protein
MTVFLHILMLLLILVNHQQHNPEKIELSLKLKPRQKREIISRLKKAKHPSGEGLEGVKARLKNELRLDIGSRYIHHVYHHDGIDLIVTMHPAIAERIHLVRSTLHDNTYKRVKDSEWNEWEVVIWDTSLNAHKCRIFQISENISEDTQGLTVARIYCNHQTRFAYFLMFKSFFETVEEITQKKLEISLLDNNPDHGIVSFTLDADAAQVLGLGDYLLTRNNPSITGIIATEAGGIVPHFLLLCHVHFRRCFASSEML